MENWFILLVTSIVLTGCGFNHQDTGVDLDTANVGEEVASLDEEENFFTEAFGANGEEVLKQFNAKEADLPAVELRDSGIQESHFLRLNGLDQYVYEVGQGEGLPVVIFLHGGPGFSYTDQADTLAGLYDQVNILFWDQIGAGKTYEANPSAEPNIIDLQASLTDLVAYTKARYGVDRVGIIGHSWGAALGASYVLDYPDDVAFYVGIGQVVTPVEDEAVALSQTRELATSLGRQDLLDQLSEISTDYPNPNDFLTLAYEAAILRSVQRELGFGTADFVQYLPLLLTNKIDKLSENDQEMLDRMLLNQRLYRELLAIDIYARDLELSVPFYLISGENDIQVPKIQSEKLIERVQAPTKEMIIIPDAGHTPMIDQEKEFIQSLTTIINRTFSANG